MLEMIPKEFYLQLYKELKAIEPQLEAQKQAIAEAEEQRQAESRKHLEREYNAAIEKRRKLTKMALNKRPAN